MVAAQPGAQQQEGGRRARDRPRLGAPLPEGPPPDRGRWVWNALPPTVLALTVGLPYLCIYLDPTHHYPPMDLFTLLALWAWCGWTWLRRPEVGEWAPA